MAAKKKPKPVQFQIGWPGLIAIVISTVCVLLWTFVLGFWMGQKVFTGCDSSKVKTTVVNPRAGLSEKTPAGQSERTESLLYGNETGLFDEKALEDLKEKLKQEEPAAVPETVQTEVLTPTGKVPHAQEEKKTATSPSTVKEERLAKAVKKPGRVKTEKLSRKKEELKKYFSLQVASYKTMTQARKEASRWEKKGYYVQIRKADLGRKGLWFRVLLGKYRTLDTAKKEAAKLASRDGVRSYVVKGGK